MLFRMRGTFIALAFAFTFACAATAAPLTVHVTVALCDNATQGIVPVPPAIGDGNDPRTNLYWGAMYGVKSWLKREKWAIQKAPAPHAAVLERIVAKKGDVTIVADAWRGSRIRDAITSFVENASGLGEGARSDLVAYIGHDGLMEFSIAPRAGTRPRKAIVLACYSRRYFAPHVKEPLLMTTGLMAPEAYTLTAAIDAHVRGGDVREAAARAYHRHQNCGIRAARRLFVSGR
jgi:hypothetical protein